MAVSERSNLGTLKRTESFASPTFGLIVRMTASDMSFSSNVRLLRSHRHP